MDLSQNIFSYGRGYHRSINGFEKSYQEPYSKQNLTKYNLNPEIIPYLPKKKNPNYISHAFVKDSLACSESNYLHHIFKSSFLFFVQILSM